MTIKIAQLVVRVFSSVELLNQGLSHMQEKANVHQIQIVQTKFILLLKPNNLLNKGGRHFTRHGRFVSLDLDLHVRTCAPISQIPERPDKFFQMLCPLLHILCSLADKTSLLMLMLILEHVNCVQTEYTRVDASLLSLWTKRDIRGLHVSFHISLVMTACFK